MAYKCFSYVKELKNYTGSFTTEFIVSTNIDPGILGYGDAKEVNLYRVSTPLETIDMKLYRIFLTEPYGELFLTVEYVDKMIRIKKLETIIDL